MTTEANGNDPRVSDAYREMAVETTPPELDRKILAMAASEARAVHRLPRTWFRPLAWAATIALSFALVLEISQVEDVAPPRADADLAEVVEESPRPADTAAKQKDEARLRQQLNKRSSDPPAAAKVMISPDASAPAAEVADAAANAPASEGSAVAADFEQDDMSLLREAEEQARMQSGPARAVAAVVEAKELLDSCDKDARASSESWYECVTLLRDAGRLESAEQELEALLVEFPDFREPPGEQ